MSTPPARTYKYYDLIMAAFVTVLICTNFISAPKRVSLGGFVFGAGIFFFPITYLFGDVLTEVYGYARSRKVVWAGFGAIAFASVLSWAVVNLPPDPTWKNQEAWRTVFGNSWRVVGASMIAFFLGEFVNSYVMAKMKIQTAGRWLWTRTIGSTIAGEAVDSLIFYPIAFYGDWQTDKLLQVMVTNYCLKVGWEVLMTPFTYRIVAYLKRAEGEDHFDYATDFTPFSLET
ncbi:queuosine precursor transporter [Isosphaeraceae bacterium EP7]